MNHGQSNDHGSGMCLAGTITASWYLRQEMADLSPLTMVTNIFVTEFRKTFREKSNVFGGNSRECNFFFCNFNIQGA